MHITVTCAQEDIVVPNPTATNPRSRKPKTSNAKFNMERQYTYKGAVSVCTLDRNFYLTP